MQQCRRKQMTQIDELKKDIDYLTEEEDELFKDNPTMKFLQYCLGIESCKTKKDVCDILNEIERKAKLSQAQADKKLIMEIIDKLKPNDLADFYIEYDNLLKTTNVDSIFNRENCNEFVVNKLKDKFKQEINARFGE
jgi:hypothetical protein